MNISSGNALEGCVLRNGKHDRKANVSVYGCQPCHQRLIEIGKQLNLRYGHQDVKLWREFEQALIQAEIESLDREDQINLAPALAG